MILTGKARVDFLKWCNFKESFGYIDTEPRSLYILFEDLFDNLQNTLIIEWFDSVGIIIEIGVKFVSDIFIFYVNQGTDDEEYSTRQEATKQAIIKANEIYNEKHK